VSAVTTGVTTWTLLTMILPAAILFVALPSLAPMPVPKP
jgi:hypothetical protein